MCFQVTLSYQRLIPGLCAMLVINLGRVYIQTIKQTLSIELKRVDCRYFAGQLGDGRAISLFETENKKGHRWELQLKGAGRTPYSRFADGYAVLRSSIREYLGSEYVAALGVPTTRAVNLILTDREVYREDAPSGNELDR